MWRLLLLSPFLTGCSLDAPKQILRAAANDLYTVFTICATIYALSFMCQPYERGLMRIILLVMAADGVMKVVRYLLE